MARRINANLMCQYACFPAPKIVMVCTDCRFERMKVAPRAVRNAVNSSAFNIPFGLPTASITVTNPFGVVLRELSKDGGGLKDSPDIDPVCEESTSVEAGVSCRLSRPVDTELIDDFLLARLALLESVAGVSSTTTFIPRDCPEEDGMNKEVTFFFLITVLAG